MTSFSNEQINLLKHLFKEKPYLIDIIRFKNRFNLIIEYCLKCAEQIPSDEIAFVIAYTDKLINELAANVQNLLFNFSCYAKEKNWTYFKQKQFAEFAKDRCELELFDQFIGCGVILEVNNGWYSFTLPEIQYYLLARFIISSADKERTYKSQFDNFEDPQTSWPYLKSLDEKAFDRLFINPTIEEFYSAVYHKDKMTLLNRYYNFFDLSIGYTYADGSLECGSSSNSNWIIDEIFSLFDSQLSIGVSEAYPCDCYIHTWKENESRQNFINYIRENLNLDGKREIIYSKMKDQQFWNLLVKTELAEVIYNGVINLKKKYKF